VVCAARPLHWREIQAFFCVDPVAGTCNPKKRRVDKCKVICGSFVDVDPCPLFPDEQAESVVKLVHQTAGRYVCCISPKFCSWCPITPNSSYTRRVFLKPVGPPRHMGARRHHGSSTLPPLRFLLCSRVACDERSTLYPILKVPPRCRIFDASFKNLD